MIIGVPKEIKDNEYRVGLVPAGAKALVDAGHVVLVERSAGLGSAIADADYEGAGASIIESAERVWNESELVVKVKEPQRSEYGFLREGLVLFTFFHLASSRTLFDAVVESGVTAVAYETLEDEHGRLPILMPMSEVAGRLSVQLGAELLTKPRGGRGVLLSGVPGVGDGKVVIVGAGTVGINALRIAAGLGAEVSVLDTDIEKFRHIDDMYGGGVNTIYSNPYNLAEAVADCDLLIGGVHIPGARTPSVITKEMVEGMHGGAVIVDVSIDQGGCVETIRPTTHSDPAYEELGVLHSAVTNLPGAVPRTSTFALTNATLPYLLAMAGKGLGEIAAKDPGFERAINLSRGRVTNSTVAACFGAQYELFSSLG